MQSCILTVLQYRYSLEFSFAEEASFSADTALYWTTHQLHACTLQLAVGISRNRGSHTNMSHSNLNYRPVFLFSYFLYPQNGFVHRRAAELPNWRETFEVPDVRAVCSLTVQPGAPLLQAEDPLAILFPGLELLLVGDSHGVQLPVAVLQLRDEQLQLSPLSLDGGALHVAHDSRHLLKKQTKTNTNDSGAWSTF